KICSPIKSKAWGNLSSMCLAPASQKSWTICSASPKRLCPRFLDKENRLSGLFPPYRSQHAFWRQWQRGDMCPDRIGYRLGNGCTHNRWLPDAAGTVQRVFGRHLDNDTLKEVR